MQSRLRMLLLPALCLMLIACACSRRPTSTADVPRVISPSYVISVAPFTQPINASQLITGRIPDNQGRIADEQLPSLDRRFHNVLTADSKRQFKYIDAIDLSRDLTRFHSSEQPQALPLWIAYVARMTGIHATIVAHTLLPLIFIPLTYYVFVQIGRKLFSDGSVKLPIFLTLVSIMQIWGNISIYTNETFFLTRTWQGKSVLANLILLVELWLMLELCAREKDRERQEETGSQLSYWLLLAVNHIAAAMMTSMGAFLTAMLFGITALVAAIRYRSWSILWKTALCCIPNVVYLVLLLVL